jgi:hypothetical protein
MLYSFQTGQHSQYSDWLWDWQHRFDHWQGTESKTVWIQLIILTVAIDVPSRVVKQTELETTESPTSNAEVKNALDIFSLPQTSSWSGNLISDSFSLLLVYILHLNVDVKMINKCLKDKGIVNLNCKVSVSKEIH